MRHAVHENALQMASYARCCTFEAKCGCNLLCSEQVCLEAEDDLDLEHGTRLGVPLMHAKVHMCM